MNDLLAVEDLVCPNCGNGGDYWIQEAGTRITWQPFQLILEDDNTIGFGDWSTYETGDETENETYECRECMFEWPSLADLHEALVSAKHARADADALERTVAGAVTDDNVHEVWAEVENALAVLIATPRIRGFLEKHDPQALEQARAALGLTTKED
jgi:hypothetical protein